MRATPWQLGNLEGATNLLTGPSTAFPSKLGVRVPLWHLSKGHPLRSGGHHLRGTPLSQSYPLEEAHTGGPTRVAPGDSWTVC